MPPPAGNYDRPTGHDRGGSGGDGRRPPLAIVTGNPARIVGYEGAGAPPTEAMAAASVEAGAAKTKVAGVALHRLPQAQDLRGLLTYAEVGEHVPFEVKRYFLVSGVATKEVRGEHAHRSCTSSWYVSRAVPRSGR